MKYQLAASLFLALSFNAAFAAGKDPSPEHILTKADQVRNPSDSFGMTVNVTNHDGDVSEFEVKTKGKDKTLIKTLSPARDKGRNLLMLKEDMWAYIPNLKKSVRVSLNQKLTGEAANGDIARMRWAGDYQAKIESSNGDSWTLFLTATKKGLTYEKIRAVVAKNSFRPLRAEYLTLSGDVLKKAEYGDYKKLAGEQRPSVITIRDAKRNERFSKIVIKDMESADFPDSLFQQTNLK
jgi:outer membrane lipoprotein-sorting protein